MTTRSWYFETFESGVHAAATFGPDVTDQIGWALSLLGHLAGDERTEAEDMLIAKLRTGDTRGTRALADVGATRAIPALAELASSELASAAARLEAAEALLRLGSEAGRTVAVKVLRTADADRYHKRAAARMLAEHPDGHTGAVLWAASGDQDDTVRFEAVIGIIAINGLAGYRETYRDVLGMIAGLMWCPLRSVRDLALTDLQSILTRSGAGETPERLGLTWRADDETEPLKSFVASLHDDSPPWAHDYAIDALTSLTGRERGWVEDTLLSFLPRDRRAVRAVGRLRVRRAIEPLREMRPSDDPTVAAAAAALRQLTEE